MTVIAIVPCSRHYNETGTLPCPVGQARAKRARELVETAHTNPNIDRVVLAFGAGRERGRSSGLTLAECFEQYLCTTRPRCEMIVNRSDHSAMTTLSEMRWVITRVQALYPDQDIEFWFVTSPRHHRRVAVICRHFFPQVQVRVFQSSDRPISWVVEGLGYAKLAAIGIFGEARIEAWRYRTVRPRYRK